jgi:hypothetical protein
VLHKINGNRPFAELEKRLKCKRCGRKAARLVVLTPVWPDQAGR